MIERRLGTFGCITGYDNPIATLPLRTPSGPPSTDAEGLVPWESEEEQDCFIETSIEEPSTYRRTPNLGIATLTRSEKGSPGSGCEHSELTGGIEWPKQARPTATLGALSDEPRQISEVATERRNA